MTVTLKKKNPQTGPRMRSGAPRARTTLRKNAGSETKHSQIVAGKHASRVL